jgi:hypothetical protein
MRTDGSFPAGGTILSGHLEQTVGIDLEGSNKFGLASGHWWDASKLEFSEKPVITALSTFTLVAARESVKEPEKIQAALHRESNGGLIILNSSERPRLVGRDGGVSGNDNTEDITLHGNTEGKRGNVEQKQVLGLLRCLASKNSSLNSGTIGDGLIGIDGLVQLTATEVFRDQRLYFWDTSGTTDKDNIVNLLAGHFGIFQNLFNGIDGRLEQGSINFLETSPRNVSGEVFTLESDEVSCYRNSGGFSSPGTESRPRRWSEQHWRVFAWHVHRHYEDVLELGHLPKCRA